MSRLQLIPMLLLRRKQRIKNLFKKNRKTKRKKNPKPIKKIRVTLRMR